MGDLFLCAHHRAPTPKNGDPADRGEMTSPWVYTPLMEYVLALARQHTYFVALLKVDNADGACLATNLVGHDLCISCVLVRSVLRAGLSSWYFANLRRRR